MKEIGGYFELETHMGGSNYHPNAIALNTGRNALEYILRVRAYKKVYLPAYYCDVMLEPLAKLGVACSFYPIDLNFEFEDIEVQADEGIIYINYFGLKDDYVKVLATKYATLIVDNAQAFFATPIDGVDTYYSVRKYFGVPDGAYLYIDKLLPETLATHATATEHYRHLKGRLTHSAQAHYADYVNAEHALCHQPIMRMSPSTAELLSSVNYERAMERRKENYEHLHAHLKGMNRLQIPTDGVYMCYPLLVKPELPFATELKAHLIKNKVYVPTFWPNVRDNAVPGTMEYDLAHHLVCLPVDHRYIIGDMDEILLRMLLPQ